MNLVKQSQLEFNDLTSEGDETETEISQLLTIMLMRAFCDQSISLAFLHF